MLSAIFLRTILYALQICTGFYTYPNLFFITYLSAMNTTALKLVKPKLPKFPATYKQLKKYYTEFKAYSTAKQKATTASIKRLNKYLDKRP